MTNKPNPYDTNKVIGAGAGQSNRALVVNIQDPLKAGRVQIRVVGHMDDLQSIPDEKLPWVKVRASTSTPSMQTIASTHGLLPGTMVSCEAMGQGGQDWMITGTIPTDRKDDNQTIHPATQGKGDTDSIHNAQQYKEKKYSHPVELSQIVNNKTTQQARKYRDTNANKPNRTESNAKKASEDNSDVPTYYGPRNTSKDKNGGTIGAYKFSGKDAQQFIQQTVQNRSAIVPNALNALQQLKQVNGNPNSIQAIGAGNFASILSQLSQWFQMNGNKNQKDQQNFDCATLLQTPDDQLDAQALQSKQICLMVQQQQQEDESQIS
jgi:hypothetical protein